MKIIKNYMYNSSYQLLLIILPIITLPYVARILGPTCLGINSYTYSFTNYFVLIAVLGTTTYAQREIAYIREDHEKVIHFFWEIELLNVITTAFSYLIFVIVLLFMPKYHVFFWAYSLSIVANVFDVSWLFMGMENFAILAIRNAVIKICSVAFIFILVKNNNDLLTYVLINSGSILLSNLSLWTYVKKWNILVPLKDIKKLHPFSHFRGTFALFIPQISITLYTLLNKVLLGYMGKIKAGSYFDNADKIVRLTFTLLLSLSTVLMPVIANEIAKKNRIKVQNLLRQSLLFSVCISVALFFGFLSVSDRLVPLFLGKQFGEVSVLLKIQAFTLIPMAVANVIGNQYLIPSRKSKQLNISIFSGSLFNILISIPLILKLGALGASVSILFSETLVTVTQLWQVRGELAFKGITSEVFKYVIAGVIMLLCVSIELSMLGGWLSLVLGIMLGSIIYIVMLILLKANIIIFIKEIVINNRKFIK